MSGIRRLSDGALSGAAAGATAGQVPILGASGHFAPAAVPAVPALLGANGQLQQFAGRCPLGRTSIAQGANTGSNQSNGTDNSFNSITHHELNGAHVNEIVVVYFNPINSNGTANAAITITAAVQSPSSGGSNVYQLTFNGQTSVTIQPGHFAQSDPVIVYDQVLSGFYPTASGPPFTKPGFTAGYTHVLVRTHGSVSSGKWQNGMYYYGLAGEGYESGSSLTDKSLSGTVATPSTGGLLFGPAMVLTSQRLHQPIAAVLGDSIVAGTGETTGGGFVERAFAAASPAVPMLKAALGGTKPPYLTAGAANQMQQALNMIIGCSHAITASGINFFFGGATPTLASCQESMWRDWTMLTELGMKVYQPTIMPYTTSTDSWATTTNQTPLAGETTRTQLNDWIRTLPAPLTGYIEVADTVESARNSGKWKASYTTDGLHPNSTGHAAAAVPVATALAGFTVS